MHSIEFVGLPGVGKTTLSNSLVNLLQWQPAVTVLTPEKAVFYAAREHCEEALRKILYFLPDRLGQRLFSVLGGRTYWQQDFVYEYILDNHQQLQSILEFTPLKTMSRSELKTVFTGLLQSGAVLKCLQKNAREDWWIVFDEGMLQKSMMFVSPCNVSSREAVEGYLSQLLLPDVVVHLHIEKEVCLQRMFNRAKGLTGRLRPQSREQIEAFLENSLQHWQFVLSWLRMHTEVPVLELRTDKDRSELVRQLEGELSDVVLRVSGRRAAE